MCIALQLSIILIHYAFKIRWIIQSQTFDFSEYWIELLKQEKEKRSLFIQDSKTRFEVNSLAYADFFIITKIYSSKEDNLSWTFDLDERIKEYSVFVNGKEITPPLQSEDRKVKIEIYLEQGVNTIELVSSIRIDTCIEFRPFPFGIKNFLGKHGYPFDEYELRSYLQFPHNEETKMLVQIPQDYLLAEESGLYLEKHYDPRHLKLSDFVIRDLNENIYILEGDFSVFDQTEIVIIFRSCKMNLKIVTRFPALNSTAMNIFALPFLTYS